VLFLSNFLIEAKLFCNNSAPFRFGTPLENKEQEGNLNFDCRFVFLFVAATDDQVQAKRETRWRVGCHNGRFVRKEEGSKKAKQKKEEAEKKGRNKSKRGRGNALIQRRLLHDAQELLLQTITMRDHKTNAQTQTAKQEE
jgi:hypothetical protein